MSPSLVTPSRSKADSSSRNHASGSPGIQGITATLFRFTAIVDRLGEVGREAEGDSGGFGGGGVPEEAVVIVEVELAVVAALVVAEVEVVFVVDAVCC